MHGTHRVVPVSKHQDFKSNLRRGGRTPRIPMMAKRIVLALTRIQIHSSNTWPVTLLKLGSGTHRASYPMSTGGGGALSLGVKRPEREADHSPPSNAKAKNA
jgi:hypothetical protein